MNEDLRYHICERSESWEESDSRGIYLCRVCYKCEAAKLGRFRKEVLTDSTYEADESIDEDEGY